MQTKTKTRLPHFPLIQKKIKYEMWTFKQAAKFAPEDMPTSRPSSIANLLAFVIASSVVTVTVSSMTEVSKISGKNPGPIPWILCFPGSPPERYQHVSQQSVTVTNEAIWSNGTTQSEQSCSHRIIWTAGFNQSWRYDESMTHWHLSAA